MERVSRAGSLGAVMAGRRAGPMLAGAFVALAIVACGGATPSTSSGTKLNLKVAMFIDQTGANSTAGIEQANIVPMAVDDINKNSSKVNISVQTFDMQSDATTAVAQVQTALADSSFAAFAGPGGSIEAPAVNPLLAADGRPVIVQVSNLTGRGNNMFSDFPAGVDEQQAMVTQVLVPKGIKTIGIIWQNIPTFVVNVNFLKTELAANGIQVVADQGASATATDLSAQASVVLAAKPDAISFQALPTVSGPLVVQIRQKGYTGLLVGQEAHGTAAFPKGAGSAAQGFVFPSRFDVSAATPAAKTVADAYQAKYNAALDQYGLFAWTSLHVLAAAAEAVGSTDRSKLITEIGKLKFNTLFSSDTLSFDPTTGFIHLPTLILVYDAQGNKSAFKP